MREVCTSVVDAFAVGFAGCGAGFKLPGWVWAKTSKVARVSAKLSARRKAKTCFDRCIRSLRLAEFRALRRIRSEHILYIAGWRLKRKQKPVRPPLRMGSAP